MKSSQVLFVAGLFLLTAAALAIRLPRLAQRPMHGDEANQAVKAGILLETGQYRYDPVEHHGPSLYWLTLPSFWLHGRDTFADTSETDYRIVPVVFGVGLILLLWLVADGLGRGAAVFAGLWTAISPAFVFYSRYYIQETLLVFFTLAALAAGWRYVRSQRILWAILCGASVGMMHATKETWILAAAAAGLGAAMSLAWTRWREGDWLVDRAAWRAWLLGGLVVAGLVAGFVTLVLYSSFGRNPRGPLDSLLAYSVYLRRGSESGIHSHPWYYYLELLFAFRPARGFFWSEGLIAGLALVGMLASLSRRALPEPQRYFCRFLTFYTLALTAVYASVSYKTPWCLLSFFHGMVLLAGIGAWHLLRLAWLPRWRRASETAAASRSAAGRRYPWLRLAFALAVTVFLAAGLGHLGRQCYMLNFRLAADQRNPYVYAHTSGDVKNLARAFERLARASPAEAPLTVHVVTPENYWPLPWYLRHIPVDRVGYWQDAARWIREAAAGPAPGAIILTPDVQPQIDAALPAAYNQQMMFGLRPNVLLHVYVRDDLWERFLAPP